MKHRILALSIILVILLSVIPLATPVPVAADSEVFSASDDTFIYENHPDNNYDGLANLRAGRWYSYPSRDRSVLKFSVSWGIDIPAGATITAATLALYYEGYATSDPEGLTVYADRLLRTDFDEGEATWNVYKTGSSWTTAGAGSSSSDYTTAGRASDIVPAGAGWMDWNVLTQVQWAQTNDEPVAFRISVQNEPEDYVPQWFSSEYGSSGYRPKLTITYTPPPSAPTVTTSACTDSGATSFMANGEVTDDDGETITRRGFTYMEGESGDPADVIEVLNPSFENGDPPSDWSFARCVGDQEATIKVSGYGSYSLELTGTATSDWAYSYQFLSDWADWKGETITLGAWVRADSDNVGSTTKICITDGITGTFSSAVDKDDAWHWVTVTKTISMSATNLAAVMSLRDSGTTLDVAYFDGVILIHDDEILAVYEDDAFGEMEFDLEISDLDSATSYRVRAFAQSDAGIGYGSSVTCSTLSMPSIMTMDASNVASTSAKLNSALVSDGGDDCTIKFGWGLTSEFAIEDYDSYETLPGTYNTGQYPYLDVSSLLPGYTYYFRVSATNGVGTDTGDELTFETEVSISAPTNFIGYPESTSISLSWSKGSGSMNTLVRYSSTSYPATTSAGIYVYLGPSSTYTLEDLMSGTTYYFSAWGKSSGNYSASYATLLMTTSAGGADTIPDIDVPDQPPGWFSAPDYTSMAGLGIFYDTFNSILDIGRIPRETGWFLGAVALAVIVGLITYLKLGKKLMIGMAVLTVGLAIGYFAKLIPWWIPLMTLILVIAFAMTHKEVSQP